MSSVAARLEARERLWTRQYLSANMECEKVRRGLVRLNQMINARCTRESGTAAAIPTELQFCCWIVRKVDDAIAKVDRLQEKVGYLSAEMMVNDMTRPSLEAARDFFSPWQELIREIARTLGEIFLSTRALNERIEAADKVAAKKAAGGDDNDNDDGGKKDDEKEEEDVGVAADDEQTWDALLGGAFDDEEEAFLDDHDGNVDADMSEVEDGEDMNDDGEADDGDNDD